MRTINRQHTSVSISMPNDVYKRVYELSEAQERTFSCIVVKMVKECLARQEQDSASKDANS